MCGIAGTIAIRPFGTTHAGSLARSLTHRGPDDIGFGFWDGSDSLALSRRADERSSARCMMTHRRLSILDLSDAGWQPMVDPDHKLLLTYNGEIYNYRELREELERLGHRFRSTGDTEVLLTAWSEWGSACLKRLVGMFAIGILDLNQRILTLARDPYGIKPLYYASRSGRVDFCSEIQPLLELSSLPRRANPVVVSDYLRLGLIDHSDATFFDGVTSVLPGHLVEVSADTATVTDRTWYTPDLSPLDITFSEAADELRGRFIESVSLHMRSDVPVGFALSGGLDSSAIVCAARAVAGVGASLHAFSYVADDPRLSERKWATLAADAARASITDVRAEEGGLVEDLDTLVRRHAEPFNSTSVYAQYRVFATARQHGIKVMLDGQGADELFAGYLPLIPARCIQLLRSGHLVQALRIAMASGRPPSTLNRRWYLSRSVAGVLPRAAVSAVGRRLGYEVVPHWINSTWFEREVFPKTGQPQGQRVRSLSEALELAFTSTSLPGLLRNEDRDSMAHSVESRVPFLAPRVVEFARRLPDHAFIDQRGTTKSVFRAAMRGLVPDQILDRRDKIGFETPELSWLRALEPWIKQTLSSPAAQEVDALNLTAVTEEFAAILGGVKPFGWHLWRCINLVRWAEVMDVGWT